MPPRKLPKGAAQPKPVKPAKTTTPKTAKPAAGPGKPPGRRRRSGSGGGSAPVPPILGGVALAAAPAGGGFKLMTNYSFVRLRAGDLTSFQLEGRTAEGTGCTLLAVGKNDSVPLVKKMLRAMADAWPNANIPVVVNADGQIVDVG